MFEHCERLDEDYKLQIAVIKLNLQIECNHKSDGLIFRTVILTIAELFCAARDEHSRRAQDKSGFPSTTSFFATVSMQISGK